MIGFSREELIRTLADAEADDAAWLQQQAEKPRFIDLRTGGNLRMADTDRADLIWVAIALGCAAFWIVIFALIFGG